MSHYDGVPDFPSLEFKITALRDVGLYDIMFRNAGVGCLFYEGPRDDGFAVGLKTGEWKRHLVVKRYYPTLSRAIDAEYPGSPWHSPNAPRKC